MKRTSLLTMLVAAMMMMSCTTKSTQNLDFAGYLFAYFEGGGDPHQQEQLRFAISEDALNWHALNGNRPIIASDTISNSGGIRDPYIMYLPQTLLRRRSERQRLRRFRQIHGPCRTVRDSGSCLPRCCQYRRS